MNVCKVGLIPSPDLPADIVAQIRGKLVKDMETYIHSDIEWSFETVMDPVIGSAEHISQAIDISVQMKQTYDWDFVVCLTDLPNLSRYKSVIADVSTQDGAALVSLPAFGAFPLKKRIRKALTFIIDLMYQKYHERDAEQEISHIKWRFLFSRIKRVIPEESNNTDARFILQSKIIGWLRILFGMVLANRPWTALASFKKILTVAFATGTYISIFSTPWQLSVAYTPTRFILLMTIAITGMVIWTTVAHDLWERPSVKSQNQYRRLYNVTTILSLVVITVVNYCLLYLLFSLSISLFVPSDLFAEWTQAEKDHSIMNAMRLAWMATSLGFLTGAVGVTAEKGEKIRHITYSYRQLDRSYEAEERRPKTPRAKTRQMEGYEGTEQTHREGDVS